MYHKKSGMQTCLRGCVAAVLLWCFMALAPALAQQAAMTVDELSARYPKGSISEVEQADKALAGVEQARSQVESRFAAEQRECFPKFFATSCLEKAQERRRADLARISPIEIEANMFKRKANVAERDRALAEKQAKDAADAEERAKKLPENERAAAEKADRRDQAINEDKARQANPPPVSSREAQHAARVQALQAEEQRKAPERAKNAADHQKKVQEAQERQRRIEEKKQKKAAEKATQTTVPGNNQQ